MEQNIPLLQAREVHKRFTHPVALSILKGVSLDVYRGQSVAIVGGSGQGKSTLLQILGTLESPSEGTLWIKGIKAGNDRSCAELRRNHIGFIFQNFHLIEEETALRNVLMPALIMGETITKGSSAYARGMELLEKVGLSERAHFLVKLLSGGEKQRVALARALCNDPALILADEPSGNLDRETATKIHSLLLSCASDLGKGVVIVTHDKELAQLCDKVYRLHEGIIAPLN